MAARKAVSLDPFSMVVVDLSIPVEPKLTLVKETCHHQPDAKVITLEKENYLKKSGAFFEFSSVDSIGQSTNRSGFLNSITLSLVMVWCASFLLKCFLFSRTLNISWKDTSPNLSNTTLEYIYQYFLVNHVKT